MQELGFAIDLGGNYPLLGREDDYADFPIRDYLIFSEPSGSLGGLDHEARASGFLTAFEEHEAQFPARPLIVLETTTRTWQNSFGQSIELIVARSMVHSYGNPPSLQRAKHKGRVEIARFALSGSLRFSCQYDGRWRAVRGHWTMEAARPLFDGSLIDPD